MWGLRTARHQSRLVVLVLSRSEIHAVTFSCKRLLPFCAPQASRVFAILTLKLISHPKQRAVDHGAVVADQAHDACFDDEAAKFDQMPGALAALYLP